MVKVASSNPPGTKAIFYFSEQNFLKLLGLTDLAFPNFRNIPNIGILIANRLANYIKLGIFKATFPSIPKIIILWGWQQSMTLFLSKFSSKMLVKFLKYFNGSKYYANLI